MYRRPRGHCGVEALSVPYIVNDGNGEGKVLGDMPLHTGFSRGSFALFYN
jgi:hypothetical protein